MLYILWHKGEIKMMLFYTTWIFNIQVAEATTNEPDQRSEELMIFIYIQAKQACTVCKHHLSVLLLGSDICMLSV